MPALRRGQPRATTASREEQCEGQHEAQAEVDPDETAGVTAERPLRAAEDEQPTSDGNDGAGQPCREYPRLRPTREVAAAAEPLEPTSSASTGTASSGRWTIRPWISDSDGIGRKLGPTT